MVQFHVDQNVSPKVAPMLCALGHPSVHAFALGMGKWNDEEHLLTAAQYNRIVITNNEKDFILLHDAWMRWTQSWGIAPQHMGILVIPNGMPITDIIQCLHIFLSVGDTNIANQLHGWNGERWEQRIIPRMD